jgi:hypothetical protein
LDQHALKKQRNSGALGFLVGDRITRFLHLHDKITPHFFIPIFVTFMTSICFCDNYDLLEASELYEAPITSVGSLVLWEGDKITQRCFKS